MPSSRNEAISFAYQIKDNWPNLCLNPLTTELKKGVGAFSTLGKLKESPVFCVA